MNAEVTSPQNSRLWTQALATRFLQPLRPGTEARLDRIPWIADFPNRDLAVAALMTRLVSRYAYGTTPDGLMAELIEASGELGRPMAAEDAREIVLIAVLITHSAALPFPRWWAPIYHAEHFAIACAREARAAGMDPAALVGDRLMFPAKQRDEILETSEHEPGVLFAVDREAAGEMAARLEGHLDEDVAEEILKAALLATHEALGERNDLAFTTAQIAQLRASMKGAMEAGEADLVAFIRGELRRLVELMQGLSSLEQDLMREVGADEQLLMDAAGIARTQLTLSKEMAPTSLTDLIDGEREVPRGLEIYFGLAGQTYQQRVGPIVSWSITFERVLPDDFDREGPIGLGFGFVEEVDTEFIVRVSYEGEDADSHIYYPPGSATATLALAVLALSQAIRLDFFVLSGNRAIEHIAQRGAVIDNELQQSVFDRAVERCRALMADGREGVIAELGEEHSGRDAPMIAFLMNDSGKSEQLLDALVPSAALGPAQVADAEQELQLAKARRRLLEAEARRIERPDDQTRAEAGREGAEYIAQVQRMRAPHERAPARNSIADVERLVEGVASRRRAIVHLTVDSRGLELAWVDQASSETEVELLNFAEVDLSELGDALREPEEGSILALDQSGGAGALLGRRIAEHAAKRGVEQLLVCPTRHLHRLPIHALPIEPDTDRRLLDAVEVSYVPSAAIAAQLFRLPARPGPHLVVAEAGDLEYGEQEASLVARLTDAEEVLVGESASTSTVLDALRSAARFHLCGHGNYEPEDYLASGFSMPSPADPDGYLSAARILAAAELKGMDLAVLGACQSGAGQTAPSTLDVAGGLDASFLAAGVRNVLSALWEIDDLGALFFHGEFHRRLANGETLYAAYRGAVDLLRSGDWRQVADLPLGAHLADLGVDLDDAFAQIEPGDDGEGGIDLSDLHHWAPYRVCGIGSLDGE